MENNKKEQVKKVDKPTKEEEVILVTTTYYYWRNWVKSILLEGKIKARFIKDDVGWSGKISVPKSFGSYFLLFHSDVCMLSPTWYIKRLPHVIVKYIDVIPITLGLRMYIFSLISSLF